MACITSLCLASAPCVALSADAFATMRTNMAHYLVDQLLNAPIAPGDSDALHVPPFDGDGVWNDVDYASRRSSTWPAKLHLRRMYGLAAQGAPESRSAAIEALAAWVRIDPQSDNWWNQEIGTPKSLCETMILLGDDLPAELRDAVRPILDRSKPGRTGQNRTWLAGIHAMKGMIYGDANAVAAAHRTLLDELKIVGPGVEGLQDDFTFHQHGPQMQLGTYGLSFFREMTKWATVFDGTPYAFPSDKLVLLEHFFTDALQWPVYCGTMDFSACGRQIVGDYPATKAHSVFAGAAALKRIGCLADFDPDKFGTLAGSRYFPSSAYLVHRAPEFFFALRMCAPDIVGAETVNSENLLGRYTADGATYFRTAGNGFIDSIRMWDWSFIPGTTEAIRKKPDLKVHGRRNQDGGSATGAVEDGIATAEMSFRASEFVADKRWRCAGNGFEATGSGISSESVWRIVTTIDQRLVQGTVTIVGADGNRVTLADGDQVIPMPAHIEHAGIAYDIASADGELHVGQSMRRGSWRRINAAASDEPVEGKMLLIYIDHGVRPSGAGYRYSVTAK